MAPKRAAPSEAAPAAAKKVKAAAKPAAASPAKTRSKSRLAKVDADVKSLGANLKKVARKAKAKAEAAAGAAGAALESAGELLIDDAATPQVAESRGEKLAKGAKKAVAQAKAKAGEVIENAGELLIDDVAPEPTSKGKKRKTAEDFIAVDAPESKKPASKKEPKEAAKKEAKKPASKGKKAAAKAPSPAPAQEDEDEDEAMDEDRAFETESEDGGADSSDDDSDAEDVAVREAGKKINVAALTKPSKDDKSVAQRLKKAQKKKAVERGTLYLSRIPHGFYEDEMREYFGQFGDVTRLRLARNPKSGASRHYAYVEFSSLPVAEVVAETMHNYLLMGHILKCYVVPQDEVHPELWVGANKKFRKVPRARLEKVRQDKPRTKEQQQKANEKVLRRQEERRQKIKAAGIDYDFEGH